MASKKQQILPGPWELAKEAWALFLRVFWSLVKVFLVNIGVALGAMIVAGLLAALILFLFGGNITFIAGLLLGLLVTILVLFFIVVSMWVQAAYLVVLRDKKEKIIVKETMQQASPFIKPLFVTSLLASVLVFGGYVLILIPGIILAVWFSLNQFVVVTEKKHNLFALQTSREYIRGRFWLFVWRMVAVYLPVMILGLLAGITQGEGKYGLERLIQLLSFIAGPFYLVYTYVLFEHLTKMTTSPKKVSQDEKKKYMLIAGAGYFLLIVLLIIAFVR